MSEIFGGFLCASLSADDGVIKNAGFDMKKTYTEAIYSAAAGSSSAPNALSTGFNGGKKILKKRFLNIMTKINKKNGAILLVVVAVAVVIIGAAVGFSMIPENSSDENQNNNEIGRALKRLRAW